MATEQELFNSEKQEKLNRRMVQNEHYPHTIDFILNDHKEGFDTISVGHLGRSLKLTFNGRLLVELGAAGTITIKPAGQRENLSGE